MKKEEYFYLKDGTALKSVEEFYDALDTISDEDFNSHITNKKNDFADWVKQVFKQEHLYKMLMETKTRDEMNDALEDFFRIPHEYNPTEQLGVEIPSENNSVPEDKLLSEVKEDKPGFFKRLFSKFKKKKKDGEGPNIT